MQKHSTKPQYPNGLSRNKIAYWTSILSVFIACAVLVSTVILWFSSTTKNTYFQYLAESINRDYVGKDYQIPAEGVDFRLEARIVGTDTWYHDMLVAEFGDQIELRLRIAISNPNTVASFHYGEYWTAGLKPVDAEQKQQFVDMDGSLVDRLSSYRELVAYQAIGIYKFTIKDWVHGEAASMFSRTFSGELNGAPVDDFVERFYVITSYGSINLPCLTIIIVSSLILAFSVSRMTQNDAEWRQTTDNP